MKFRQLTNLISGVASSVVMLMLGAQMQTAHATDARFAAFPPDVAQAMEAEQAAAAEAGEAGRRQTYVRDGGSERRFDVDRSIQCLKKGSAVPPLVELSQSAEARKCWIQWTDTRTQVFKLYAAAAVDPLNGWEAKIEHTANGTILSYSDSGGTPHRYAVMRPKFAQGLVQGDLGGWMHLAPDHKSGVMFNLGANGGVTGKPANPLMLQMMAGQQDDKYKNPRRLPDGGLLSTNI